MFILYLLSSFATRAVLLSGLLSLVLSIRVHTFKEPMMSGVNFSAFNQCGEIPTKVVTLLGSGEAYNV